MTKKTESIEELKAIAEKQAASLPKSAGALIEDARKADTRADADQQTNQLTDPNAVNLVQQLQSVPVEEKKEKAKPLSEGEYYRRTHLDVSNPEYINPSLDTVK